MLFTYNCYVNYFTYGCFAIEREETPKKSKFFFICQICSKYYNLFRFNINSKNNFFRVSSLSTAKCPYIPLNTIMMHKNNKKNRRRAAFYRINKFDYEVKKKLAEGHPLMKET